MVVVSDIEYKILKDRLKELEFALAEYKWIEQEYKTIIQTALDGFWVADMKGRILEVNKSYCDLTGYTREELLWMSIPDLEINEKPQDTVKHIKKVMEMGQDRFESRHRCKDGKIIEIEASVSYVKERERMFVFLRDISEQKRAEAVLKESEEKYRALVENASDQIFMFDEEYKMISLNDATLRMFGKKRDEVIGKHISELFPKEIADKNIENIGRIFKTGQNYQVEEELVFGEQRIFVSSNLNPIKNTKGKTVAVMGIVRDITERKKAEEELKNYLREEEILSKAAVGRELKIIEMEKEVNELLAELGRDKKFKEI